MSSLGLVSPARRTANSTPRKVSSSKKQVPIREYYIPASASVQELKQATLRQYEDDEIPVPSSSRRPEVPRQVTPRHQQQHQQQNYTSQSSSRSQSSRNAIDQQTPIQAQAQRARTTSVARRVVLRGPDSAAKITAQASSAPGRAQDREYLPPEETTRYSSKRSDADKGDRREASSPSLRHTRQPSTFRYEQEKPSSKTQASEARQQAFSTRVHQLSASQSSSHRNNSTSHSPSSASRQLAHLPSPSTASTDDLDSDFILQFAKDNKLELGAEVAQSLVRGSTRRTGKSPLVQRQDARTQAKQQQYTRNDQPALVQSEPRQQQEAPPRSPLLTPDMAMQSPHHSQPSPTQTTKPPRPPKSSRRLSATPSPVTPAPPAPSPRTETQPERDPQPVTQQAMAEENECAYASVFDDADEDETGEVAIPPQPVKSESYSRRTSMSSTRPSRDRRERSYSNSSRHQSKQAHSNSQKVSHSPTTPATPKIPPEHALQAETRNITPQASTSLILDESPSEAKTLISQYDDHAREDYERNRRLSSLLKGLGIQTRAKSPEMMKAQMELEEHEEEELWRPIASNSNIAEIYGDSDVDEQEQEEEESVMLTGDSFQTAPDNEEGVEIWGHETLMQEANHRSSNGSLDSESISHDESQDYGDEDSDGSQSDREYDHDYDADDKRWYEEDSHRSRHSLRRSYSDKPQPLPPEYTIDEVRRSIIEQRASLGIADSVLAGILATDSFCMPDGIRMSIEQIAARLSMDKARASNGSFRRTRRTTSGHTNSSLPYAGRDRYLSVASSTELPLSATGRRTWDQEAFPAHLSDNAVEVIQEPEGGYAEEDLPPLPTQDAEVPAPTPSPRPAGTPVDPTWRQSNLSMSEAIALRPLPLELPSEDEASKPVENIPARKRTRSVSAFQRLSSTFTGTTNKTKSRKRLPSFLSGFVGSSKNSSQQTSTKKAITSPIPSTPAKTVETSPQPSLRPPSNHKRASTGPPRLVDIANEVTNTPDPARIDVPKSPASPAESSRSKTMGQLPGSTESWRSTVPEHVYASLARTYSKSELRRQEVIYELYRTEESFVNGLKGVVRVFSQPLRTPQGRWIAGVPTPVARLLDWLDDIVYLHSQITTILVDCRHSQGHVVHKLADALLDFLPRLEVHQPYLIRFESVTKSIDDMVVRPDSDFGEFVRMQQALPECGAMPLSSFLLKPVQRLMKYPLFFKQLRDLTPAQHPDHESTQGLLEMTDSMIRAMEGVKVREEEYESLKGFASKIIGLPTGLVLAKRDRRLLGQGAVNRIDLSDVDRHSLEDREEDLETSYRTATSQPMSSAHKAAPLHSNSRRSIISDSAYGSSPRPMSYFSDAGSLAPSMFTGYSVASTNWEGSNTFSPPIPASSSIHSRATSPSMHSSNVTRSAITGASLLSPHSHSGAPPLPSNGHSSSHSMQKCTIPSPPTAPSSLRGILKSSSAIAMSKQAKASREQPLHVFIFSDLVLFSTANAQHNGVTAGVRGLGLKPSKSSLKLHPSSTNLQALQKDGTRYTVVDDWGVAKLIGVTDLSGRTEHENLYKLDLLPLWSEADEKRPFTLRTAALCTTIYVSLPDPASAPASSLLSHRPTPSTSTMQRDLNGRPLEHAMLLEAIDRSYVHSLQNIGFNAVPPEEPIKRSRRTSIAVHKLQKDIQGLHEAIKATSAASIPRSPSQQRFNAASTSDPSTDTPRSPMGYNDPHSPSSALFDASAHRPDDLAEREERLFWSYRYKKIKTELSKDGIEAQMDEIVQSGLLHCSIDEIEAIIENLNGGENEDLIPDRLVNSLRQIKDSEKKLRSVLKEAKNGVRMIPASNSSVGLAISYPSSASNPANFHEERAHRTSEESQDYSFEQGTLSEDVSQYYDEPHSQLTSRGHGTRVNDPTYLRVDDMRYREQDQRRYDDEDDDQSDGEEETGMSESDYDSNDEQEYLNYEDDAHVSPPPRPYAQRSKGLGAEDWDNTTSATRASRAVTRAQLSPRAHQSPRIHVQSSPRVQPSPRTRQSPRMQQEQSPKLQSTPRIQQSPRTNVKASPRLQQGPVSAASSIASSSMQREGSSSSSSSSSSKQQRYGAYYRPSGTASPASMSNSPRMPSSSASASMSVSSPTVLQPKSPSMTPSRTSPNHLALASQMRRERRASHSSPNLHASSASSTMSPCYASSDTHKGEAGGGRGGRRRAPSRESEALPSSMPTQIQKEREAIQPSPSLETVFTVQRAQRVPLTRRL